MIKLQTSAQIEVVKLKKKMIKDVLTVFEQSHNLTNEVQINRAISFKLSLSHPCCTRKVSSQGSCLSGYKNAAPF